MEKSLRARIMSDLLKFWPKYTEDEYEQILEKTFNEGEKQTPAPKTLKTRIEDTENGRIFYVNEKSESRYVIFYIHGGAYIHDIILPHWQLIEKLAKKTDAQIIVPAYRLVPFATYKEGYDLIVPLYKECIEKWPDKKFILMGDSAGGGFSLALAEFFKNEGIRMPDELVLICPWVDVSMDNDDIKEFQEKDPFLSSATLKIDGKRWAGELDVHDPRVSPIYGDLSGIHNVTVFVGTCEILNPDIIKFYEMLDADPSNELNIAEEMNHVYPLMPIPEAKPAVEKIIQTVLR